MGEFQNPEAERLSEIESISKEIDKLDKELASILDGPESDERNIQRDEKQAEIDSLKEKLFGLRTFKENLSAIDEFVQENLEMYREFVEMGLPVDEETVARDVFQSEEVLDYLEEVREILDRHLGE